MLILGRVAALDIAKRRVGLNNTHIAKIFQCAHVLFLLSVVAIDSERAAIFSLQPAAAECKSSKGLVDVIQQFLGTGQTEGNMRGMKVLHVMRAFHILYNISSAGSKY